MQKDNFDLYSEKVMQYFLNPINMGKIKNASAIATVGNPKCGDVMKVYIKIGKRPLILKADHKLHIANGKNHKMTRAINNKQEVYIKDIKVQTLGCGAAIATSSVATEMVKGKTLKEAMRLTNQEVIKKLGGLPKTKYHCSILAEEGIKKAIKQYQEKNK